jgi:4-hydroxy-tetrahydrodipicolinate reductase
MRKKMIRIVQVGIGPLGRKVSQYVAERPNMSVVAAVDSAPALAGRNLGELCSCQHGSQQKLDVPVSSTLEQALSKCSADVAVLTTVSDVERIEPQIEQILGFGLPVVTTCEELAFPWETAARTASRIDRLAKEKGAAVLATGVNPGFLMDSLPVFLSAVCQRLDAVKVSRIQDASTRRVPFQRKIGAGLSLAEFEEKRTQGSLRHVGLTESMHMIASRVGWTLERTEDRITPVVASRKITSGGVTIEKGMAAGVQQIGRGFADSEEKITLVFRASVGEPSPEDTVELLGIPHIVSTIPGGIHGDVATCAITLNAIGRVLHAEPGLRTMVDLPPISYFLRQG